MRQKYLTATAPLLLVILILLLSSCVLLEKNLHSTETINSQLQVQLEELFRMCSVPVQRNGENDLVIAMTADDFVKEWNGVCDRENKPDVILPPLNEFNTYAAEEAIHSDHPTRHYVYAPGEERFYPILDLYVSEMSGELLQVDLTYDEHNYREETWKLHEGMCMMTLSVLLPGMTAEELQDLCVNVNELGARNSFSNEEKYDRNAVPAVLIYHNKIGVYSYSATGSRSHFCVLPVDESRLNAFKEAGTELSEIII